MSDSPPASAAPLFDAPPGSPAEAPVVCKLCTGDPGAKRHTAGCPKSEKNRGVKKGGAFYRRQRAAAAAAADQAPKSATPKPPGVSRGTKRPYAKALTEYVGTMGSFLSMAGQVRGSHKLAYDGEVLMRGAQAWAESMEALAYEDPRVAAVLDAMIATSSWSQVAVSSAAIVVPILACHRVLPPESATLFGMPAPPRDWSQEDVEHAVPPSDDGGVWPSGVSPNGRTGPVTQPSPGPPIP